MLAARGHGEGVEKLPPCSAAPMMEDCWCPVDAVASAPERPPGWLERTSQQLR